MEIYLEFTYLINWFLIILALEMMTILVNKALAFDVVLKQSLFLSLVIILVYFDYVPYLMLLLWLLMLAIIYRRQVFLYFPVFLTCYFSLVYFSSSMVKTAFIYNGIIITPLDRSFGVLLVIIFLLSLFQVLYLIYLKRKIRINEYLFKAKLMYQNNLYEITGFLDSGNEVYYHGFPLILINKMIIDDYMIIDTIYLSSWKDKAIEVIKIDYLIINQQRLDNIYAGIINNIQYDCLLNKALMGGIL